MLTQKMIFTSQNDSMLTLGDASKFGVTLGDSGRLLSIVAGEILVGRTVGNVLEGALSRIYLREHTRQGVALHCIMGPNCKLIDFTVSGSKVRWSGDVVGLSIDLTLSVDSDASSLVWSVAIKNDSDKAGCFDVVWVQDIGCAGKSALQSNEAYTAHYLDESVYQDVSAGPVLCFRQNLKQVEGQFPWVLASCLSGAESYATDAFDVYGNGYRCGEEPKGLMQPQLSNRRYQFEFSCAALQSKPCELAVGASTEVIFGLTYVSHHPEASSESDLSVLTTLRALLSPVADDFKDAKPLARNCVESAMGVHGRDLTTAELQDLYPLKWRHIEKRNDGILGFFCDGDTHVVTRAKERLVERPHGSILVGNAGTESIREVLATTVYMYGVFSAQTVYGNTSFHKMNSLPREPLGLSRMSGLRIYIEMKGGWCLLGTPSAFEMKRDAYRWIYVLEGGSITVDVSIDTDRDRLTVALESNLKASRFLLSNELVMGAAEDAVDATVEVSDDGRFILFEKNGDKLSHERSIDLSFGMSCGDGTELSEIGGSELLGGSGEDALFVVVTHPTQKIEFNFAASLEGAADVVKKLSATTKTNGADFWEIFNRGLDCAYEDDSIVRLSDALRWYSHNALIHYASPHGLEQYSGAAWGTRDACQGPFEYFIAQQHHGLAKSILLKTFSSQYVDTGDWPQWFMHDEYCDIAQNHSHGDIVVWPLKALAMYLDATGDFSIFDLELPYLNADNSLTNEAECLAGHVVRTLDRIESEFVPGTSLIRYGGGDWDDSLQPVSADLASRLVSGWTVGLLAQSLAELHAGMCDVKYLELRERVGQMAGAVKKDFRERVFIDGQVAGFLLFDDSFETAEPLLHPKDTRTGIANRLIPMTRSIIAGLLTRDEAEHQMSRIAANLKFPDGVRLMDRPAPYQGGIETFFKRAESSANIGREIGLQYVHAHIRYAEALAKLGNGSEFFEALLTICPISIEKTFSNAGIRQSNMYFSSSDAGFLDRYDAAENFDKLRDGSVEAKGGWRLYSSGPGLYSGLVIRQLFGLREQSDAWVFDPVLPKKLDGIVLTWELSGQRVEIEFRVLEREYGPKAILCAGCLLETVREENPYRDGGLIVSKAQLRDAMMFGDRLVVQL